VDARAWIRSRRPVASAADREGRTPSTGDCAVLHRRGAGAIARDPEARASIDPAYSLAHNNLGNLRLAEGRIAEARRHYEHAVETGPDNAEAHNNLGGVLVGVGEIDAAVRHLQEALRLRPAYAEAHFNLARAYAAASKFDEAIREAEEAERLAEAKPQLIEQIRRLVEEWRRRSRR